MASKPLRASNNNNEFIPIGVVDASGNPYFKAPPDTARAQAPPPGGGDDAMSEIGELRTGLKGAFLWLMLLTAAAATAFLFLISGVGDVRKDLGTVQASVAAQGATATGIQTSLTRIETKLDKADDYPQTGARRRQDR